MGVGLSALGIVIAGVVGYSDVKSDVAVLEAEQRATRSTQTKMERSLEGILLELKELNRSIIRMEVLNEEDK